MSIKSIIIHVQNPEENAAAHPDHAVTEEVASPLQSGPTHGQKCGPGDDELLEYPDIECRIVLVGKTGNGKSATANTILGLEKRFESDFQFGSLTKKCQQHSAVLFGINVVVVDTPGLFDTEMSKEEVTTEITKCLALIAPGPHAIVLVLRTDVKFTEEEHRAVEEIYRMFPDLLRSMVIVFTHGDVLNDEREMEAKLKEKLDKSPPELKAVLSDANHRYVVFNNNGSADSKQQQVKLLLTTVGRLLTVNGGRPYTTNLLKTVDKCMCQREKELNVELGLCKRRKSSSSTEKEKSMFLRDMAREEVVQEKPILDFIKKQVWPILKIVLGALAQILVALVKAKIEAKLK